MKTMTVSQFKAHALQVIAEIAASHEPMVVTKRGKAIVEVVPFREPTDKAMPGQLAHLYVGEEDIVTPLGADMWDAAR